MKGTMKAKIESKTVVHPHCVRVYFRNTRHVAIKVKYSTGDTVCGYHRHKNAASAARALRNGQ